MKIDVHAHYWTEDYIDLLVDLGPAGAVAVRGLGAGGGELEARLVGVDMQVLSKTGTSSSVPSITSATPRSTPPPHAPSSTRTPAPCSASTADHHADGRCG
jgi:hypothetical protein